SGGAVIASPALDPRSGALYVATGNPFHLLAGNLAYSSSVIALDAASGALQWADQVHPHDTRNLDLNCPPMLLRDRGGKRLLVVGGKDGIRAWDRETRKRLWHVQLTPARPPAGGEALPTTGPEAGPTAAAGGLVFFASNNHADKGCAVAAIDAASGEIRWLHFLPAFQLGPLSVAGGVVFLGLTDGKLRARLALRGTALDDYFDREVEAAERPERASPSGTVPAAVAAGLGAARLAAGIAFAGRAGTPAIMVAAVLALAILLYDGVLKGTAAGFLNMGVCRGLNFFMPMSLATKSGPTSFVFAPVLLTAYISVLTYLSREEVSGNTLERARRGVTALAVVALVMAVAVASWPAAPVGWAFLAVLVARGAMLFAPLWTEPGGPATGHAIGGGILMIPLFDATFVAAAA